MIFLRQKTTVRTKGNAYYNASVLIQTKNNKNIYYIELDIDIRELLKYASVLDTGSANHKI